MPKQSYAQSLSSVDSNAYFNKLSSISLSECPFDIKAFVDDPKKWPEVGYGDIYAYFVDSTSFYTRAHMKAFKSLEAYNYFVSGWVRDVLFYKAVDNVNLLRATVNPSQRSSDKPHQAWVATQDDGTVITAHCTCMAG